MSGRGFSFSRLGSAVGLLPLGVWTANHIWNNLSVFQGPEAWEKSVTHYAHPLSQALTLVVVLGPLLLHIAFGIAAMSKGRPNNIRYGNLDNLRFLLQRVSSLGVLAFLAAHIWLAFLRPRLLEGHPEFFGDMAAHMHHHPPTLIVYLLGTLGVAYHLANGLQTSAMTFGFVVGAKASRRFQIVSVLVGALLLTGSWMVIYAMYQAGAGYPVPADI